MGVGGRRALPKWLCLPGALLADLACKVSPRGEAGKETILPAIPGPFAAWPTRLPHLGSSGCPFLTPQHVLILRKGLLAPQSRGNGLLFPGQELTPLCGSGGMVLLLWAYLFLRAEQRFLLKVMFSLFVC